ncbi:MAG: glycosyltransferase family 4 protein, partial [Pseudomonadales bacterium]
AMIVQILIGFQDVGAVANRARHEVEALLQAGNNVTVISDAHSTDPLALRFPDRFGLVNIWPRALRGLRYRLPGEPLYAKLASRALSRLVAQHNVGLVVCHKASLLRAACRVTAAHGIPATFVIHGLAQEQSTMGVYRDDALTLRFYRAAERCVFRQPVRCVPVSRYLERLLLAQDVTPNRITVVHNPIDTGRFVPAPTEEKKIDILYVGRLSIEKGLRTLLDALRLQTRPLEVVIAGDGPLRKRLQAECGSRVRFARWVANDRLPQLIRQARVVVVPSLFEPQGVVVLEAMACGVPVIGSDTGGIPEMIEDGATGWLVPPNDPAALAQAMNTALSDETRRQQMGVAANRSAQAFALADFSSRVVQLYAASTPFAAS